MLSASDASARIPKLMSVKYFISFPSIQDFEIIILKSVKKSTIILTISGKNRFSFCAFHPDILIEKLDFHNFFNAFSRKKGNFH